MLSSSNNKMVGSYGDILNVLERMEQEEDGVKGGELMGHSNGVRSVASMKSTAQSLPPPGPHGPPTISLLGADDDEDENEQVRPTPFRNNGR